MVGKQEVSTLVSRNPLVMFVITINQSVEKICSLRGLGLHRSKNGSALLLIYSPDWKKK